jgi:ATP:corrinoid adenosyltransferase
VKSLTYAEFNAHLQLLSFRNIITLAIQIIRIESADSLEHLLVVLIHEIHVRATRVPRIKRVVADHGEGLVRKSRLLLDDVVEILVVTPGKHHFIETAAGAVNAVFGAVDLVTVVRVVLEGVGVNDLLVEGTALDGFNIGGI